MKLPPLIITGVQYDEGTVLKFIEPLRVDVRYEKQTGLYYAGNAKLTIYASARSKGVLAEKLKKHIIKLWRDYGLKEESELSDWARGLRARLLEAIETSGAPVT